MNYDDIERAILAGEYKNKEKLVELLYALEKLDDRETAHVLADMALLSYIDDLDIRDAFVKLPKWYA